VLSSVFSPGLKFDILRSDFRSKGFFMPSASGRDWDELGASTFAGRPQKRLVLQPPAMNGFHVANMVFMSDACLKHF